MAKLTHAARDLIDARKEAEIIELRALVSQLQGDKARLESELAKRPPLREQSEFAKKSAARRAAIKAYFAAHPEETTVSPYQLDEFITLGTQERFA